MKLALLVGLLVLPGAARAEPTEMERQAQHALIERDRQAAEFAHAALRNMPRRSDALPPRPDERVLRAREREAYLLGVSPVPPSPGGDAARPLPLPGRPGSAVDPIPVQRPGG